MPDPSAAPEAAKNEVRQPGGAVELAHSWNLRSDERIPLLGAPLSRLEVGKHWVKRTLEELAHGKAVPMWWWEPTPPREQILVLVGSDERRVSVRFRERVLRACAEDPEAQASVTRRLIAAIEQVGANPLEPEGS